MGSTCVFCLSSETVERSIRDRSFHACQACGGIYLDRRHLLDPASEKARYGKHNNNLSNTGYREYLERFIVSVFSFSALLSGDEGSIGTIFDYGSGPTPALVTLLREKGYEARGWDPYFASDTPRFNHGADLVTSLEVVEHFADPVRDFSLMADCVRGGGFLAVGTQLVLDSPDSIDFFAHWWYREDPTHISFYSKKALVLVAERAGLEYLGSDGKSVYLFRKRLLPFR
jgi:hypothetical protein